MYEFEVCYALSKASKWSRLRNVQGSGSILWRPGKTSNLAPLRGFVFLSPPLRVKKLFPLAETTIRRLLPLWRSYNKIMWVENDPKKKATNMKSYVIVFNVWFERHCVSFCRVEWPLFLSLAVLTTKWGPDGAKMLPIVKRNLGKAPILEAFFRTP